MDDHASASEYGWPGRAWVINLDRSPGRLARIALPLDGLGLRWTRVAGIDGRNLTAAQCALLDRRAYLRRHGKQPAWGELGCYLSHLAVMRAFLASGDALAVVFEDDAQIGERLLPVLHALARHRDAWDMVKLSAIHSGTPLAMRQLDAQHALSVMLSCCTGASAYAVNRRAAQAYMAQLLPMQLPWDHVFDRGWALRLKVRLVTPPPCMHDHLIRSDIAAAGRGLRNLPWWQRFPTYAYRSSTAWRRLWSGWTQHVRARVLRTAAPD